MRSECVASAIVPPSQFPDCCTHGREPITMTRRSTVTYEQADEGRGFFDYFSRPGTNQHSTGTGRRKGGRGDEAFRLGKWKSVGRRHPSILAGQAQDCGQGSSDRVYPSADGVLSSHGSQLNATVVTVKPGQHRRSESWNLTFFLETQGSWTEPRRFYNAHESC